MDSIRRESAALRRESGRWCARMWPLVGTPRPPSMPVTRPPASCRISAAGARVPGLQARLPRTRPCARRRPSRDRSPPSPGAAPRARVRRNCAEHLDELVGILLHVVGKARHQHRVDAPSRSSTPAAARPFSHAPTPASAVNSSLPVGIVDRRRPSASPSISSASEAQKIGTPCAKLVVPSSGSNTQRCRAPARRRRRFPRPARRGRETAPRPSRGTCARLRHRPR